ncbi:MAG: LptA/OstA family protein [Limisphaerales bacterium]
MRLCIRTVLGLIAGFALATCCVHAQVPQEAKSIKNFRKIFYRNTPQGKVPEAICSGAEANPLTGSQLELKDFTLETLRGQETQFIAKAPQCVIDVKEEYATSAGPVSGFTATTNFYIQGVGFLCTKSNSLLVISNQVETRIQKSVLKGPLPFGMKTNASDEVVRIFSDHFQLLYQSNLATYTGHVRVVDSRMVMTCDVLNTRFGTNSSIENITAERNVILTQTNGSRATGDLAVYTVAGTNETVDLIGHAHWNDGQHDVTARSFFYDGRTDELLAADRVKVHYDNGTHRPPRNADDFSELFANTATISNATRKRAKAQNVLAQGDVMMTNHYDHSFAQSYRATYSDTNGIVELTGSPMIKSDRGQISGYLLSIDRSNNVFHSRGNTSALFSDRDITARVHSTDLDYTTNEARFIGEVNGSVSKANLPSSHLQCDNLTLTLGPSNQVITAVAQGRVHGDNPAKRGQQTLSCELLTINRNAKTGLVRDVDASGDCKFQEVSSAPKAALRTLTATNFHAEFSPVTNKVERFTAQGGIVAMQTTATRTNQVTGAKLVYAAAPIEKIDVTGHPKARTDRAIISNAEIFTWLVQSSTFRAIGKYNITPTPRTKSLPSH